MAIKTVKVTIDGQTHTLSYNGSTGNYEATLTAPTLTSYNKPGGYYGVTVVATDEAGNVTSQDDSNPDNRLTVTEKIPPEISNLSPSNDSRITTASPKISGRITDEDNGSGIDQSTFVLAIDGVNVDNADIQFTSVNGGYDFEYSPSGLSQGIHEITVDVDDNDGNAATQRSSEFTVDTIAPSLNISNPVDGFITNNDSLDVAGSTSDAISSPVVVTVKVNGADQGPVSIGSGGNFTKTANLVEGSNAIEIKATDSIGNETEITRNVTLDTQEPSITNIELVPNPVDAGATYIVKVTAAD